MTPYEFELACPSPPSERLSAVAANLKKEEKLRNRQKEIEHQLWLAGLDIEKSLEVIEATEDLAVVESFIRYFEDIEALKRQWLEEPDVELADLEWKFTRARDLLYLQLGKDGIQRYEQAASSRARFSEGITPPPSLALLTDTSYIRRLF